MNCHKKQRIPVASNSGDLAYSNYAGKVNVGRIEQTNGVSGIKQNNRWSNLHGYGNIKVYTNNTQNELLFHDNKWNQ